MVRRFAVTATRAERDWSTTMDIIRHCAEQPNNHVRALLRSRALNDSQIDHFLVLACSRLIRTYIAHRHMRAQGDLTPGEQETDTLLHGMNITTLAARVNLETAFTTRVIRELAPDVIAQLHRALGSEHSLLNLFDRTNAA
jgi:hypothetical protein